MENSHKRPRGENLAETSSAISNDDFTINRIKELEQALEIERKRSQSLKDNNDRLTQENYALQQEATALLSQHEEDEKKLQKNDEDFLNKELETLNLLADYQKNIESLEERIAKLDIAITKQEEQNKSLKSQIENSAFQYDKIIQKLSCESQQETQSKTYIKNALNDKIKDLEQKISVLEKTIEKQALDLAIKSFTSTEVLALKDKEIAEISQKLEGAQQALLRQNEEIRSLEAKIEKLETQLFTEEVGKIELGQQIAAYQALLSKMPHALEAQQPIQFQSSIQGYQSDQNQQLIQPSTGQIRLQSYANTATTTSTFQPNQRQPLTRK